MLNNRYDVHSDISTNTAIGSPLLSRFDIILILMDSPDKQWDTLVSTFLLKVVVTTCDWSECVPVL